MQTLDTKPLKFKEHQIGWVPEELTTCLTRQQYQRHFLKTGGDNLCYQLTRYEQGQYHFSSSYFIGVDWLEKGKQALIIEPKLNTWSAKSDDHIELDFLKMLFKAFSESEGFSEIELLCRVDWEAPPIGINQQQDLLTPFLVMEYLLVLKDLVKKGLKRSYKKVETNLYGRVKGKALVARTIKQNLVQQKNLHTWCGYEELSLDHPENRLLKKALTFVKRYLPQFRGLTDSALVQNTFNYINPAFEQVSDKVELREARHFRTNTFFGEYNRALKLAEHILKRFSHNIAATSQTITTTPPFWIDMARLFELYVLSLLKKRFGNQVKYHFKAPGSELDYLLNAGEQQFVIDAKYKPKYFDQTDHTDMRQVSGYARLQKVYKYLGKNEEQNIDCLIIYPDVKDGCNDLDRVDLKRHEISEYLNMYKLGVKLPVIKPTK